MKTLATILLGLSLFIGSSLFAGDKFAAFYPAEDIDSPTYAEVLDTSDIALSLDSMDRGHNTVSNAIIQQGVSAFYPVEDSDSPTYAQSLDTSDAALSLDTMGMKTHTNDGAFDAFFPIEDDDSVRY